MIKRPTNYEKKEEVIDLCNRVKKITEIKIKNIPKISEKIVHLLYHNNNFEYVYYKKDTVNDCLNKLFIKENYPQEKNHLHQEMIKKNDNYVNKLIKIEREKIISLKEANRSSWESFTIWFGNIFSKIC